MTSRQRVALEVIATLAVCAGAWAIVVLWAWALTGWPQYRQRP